MPSSRKPRNTGYEIIEKGSQFVVVKLTATPSEDLARAIAKIDESIVPIVVSNTTTFVTRQFFAADEYVVIAPSGEVTYRDIKHEGLSEKNTILTAKTYLADLS